MKDKIHFLSQVFLHLLDKNDFKMHQLHSPPNLSINLSFLLPPNPRLCSLGKYWREYYVLCAFTIHISYTVVTFGMDVKMQILLMQKILKPYDTLKMSIEQRLNSSKYILVPRLLTNFLWKYFSLTNYLWKYFSLFCVITSPFL